MKTIEDYTDEWGVTYSGGGRILRDVDRQLFTCEEYTIPEGVEVVEGSFWWKDCKLRKIHLPSTLRKMDVNTFIDCPLEEIELPEGMTEVPEYMCEACRVLKKVVLPSTIQTIQRGAFSGCYQLQEVNLPESVGFIDEGAFRFCINLKQVKLPPHLKIIRAELFYCSGIESIEIHPSITDIRYWAFWGCKHLKRLVIPETVTGIDYGIVSAHEGFEGVECHAKGYHVENDALIDDANQELLCCWTQQKHYVVPECVRRIADFGGNEFVETITAKQPIELTSYDAFASDIHLKHLDFQGGVTGLFSENATFYNCPDYDKSIMPFSDK